MKNLLNVQFQVGDEVYFGGISRNKERLFYGQVVYVGDRFITLQMPKGYKTTIAYQDFYSGSIELLKVVRDRQIVSLERGLAE